MSAEREGFAGFSAQCAFKQAIVITIKIEKKYEQQY